MSQLHPTQQFTHITFFYCFTPYSKLLPLSPSLAEISSQTLVKLKMKPLTFTLALLFLLFSSSFLQATMAGSAFCDSKCKARCSKAGIQKRCLYFCGVCCGKCNCVPSGTYGNKDECPCYRDMLSDKLKPKCP